MGFNSSSWSPLDILPFPIPPPGAKRGGSCLTSEGPGKAKREHLQERGGGGGRSGGDSFPQGRGLGKTCAFVPFGTKMNHQVTLASPKLSRVERAQAWNMSQVGPHPWAGEGGRLSSPLVCSWARGRGRTGPGSPWGPAGTGTRKGRAGTMPPPSQVAATAAPSAVQDATQHGRWLGHRFRW